MWLKATLFRRDSTGQAHLVVLEKRARGARSIIEPTSDCDDYLVVVGAAQRAHYTGDPKGARWSPSASRAIASTNNARPNSSVSATIANAGYCAGENELDECQQQLVAGARPQPAVKS